jgi:hypothetical protein
LLHAALKNLFAGTYYADEWRAPIESVSNWFFQVDVFAGGYCVGCDANVPVIGNCDDYGIDIFFIEHLMVVNVSCGEAVGPLTSRHHSAAHTRR